MTVIRVLCIPLGPCHNVTKYLAPNPQWYFRASHYGYGEEVGKVAKSNPRNGISLLGLSQYRFILVSMQDTLQHMISRCAILRTSAVSWLTAMGKDVLGGFSSGYKWASSQPDVCTFDTIHT